MQAGWAQLRCLLAFVQVAAVAAAPYDPAIALEHPPGLQVGGKVAVAFAMLFLGNRDRIEGRGDLLETLLSMANNFDPPFGQ